MKIFLLIFLGGGLGSLLRHGVSLFSLGLSSTYGQLLALGIVNTLGGLFAGFMAKYLDSQHSSLFFITGIAGGFTTFSAFSLEVFNLYQKGEWSLATLFILLIVLGSLLGVWLGALGWKSP